MKVHNINSNGTQTTWETPSGKQHGSGASPTELSNKIRRWDYDKSVEKMRDLARQWGKITTEVARELYLAKEHLARQEGQRRNPDAPDYIPYTWDGYCGEIGLSRQVADYWIKKFIPREISDTGKDVLLIKAPVKTDTAADIALRESRIAAALRDGRVPADFTPEEETEYKRRLKNAETARLAEKYNAPAVTKAKDYFSEVLSHSKNIVNFKLKDSVQIQAQFNIFRYIEAYLTTFDDPETKARAAFNLALKTRNIANEIAELNFQASEAAGEGGAA
jgi:hypothetical protein